MFIITCLLANNCALRILSAALFPSLHLPDRDEDLDNLIIRTLERPKAQIILQYTERQIIHPSSEDFINIIRVVCDEVSDFQTVLTKFNIALMMFLSPLNFSHFHDITVENTKQFFIAINYKLLFFFIPFSTNGVL